MLRFVFSSLVVFTLLSSSLALAEEQAPAAAASVVAAADPAASIPATATATATATSATEPAAAVAPAARLITIEPDPTAPAAPPEAAVEPSTPTGPPPPTLTASVDLAAQRMTVMENGEFRYSWPISSGTRRYATPTGVFRPQWKVRMWHSRQYGYAPMPHAVFINGGVAVHATYATGALGGPASHGCIRLSPSNAKAFYNLVDRHGLKLTEVRVHGTPNWREPAVASYRKKRAPKVIAQNESWFWGAAPSNYATNTTYNPSFAKKKKAGPYAYRKKGSNKIVYLAQPPSSYGNGGW